MKCAPLALLAFVVIAPTFATPLNGLDAQKPLRVAFPRRPEQLRDARIHIIHQDNLALGRSEEEMHKCSFRRWFYGDCEKILGRIPESPTDPSGLSLAQASLSWFEK